MTAKAWLKRGWQLDREINSLLRTKEETRAWLMSVTASYSGEPVLGTRDPHRYDRLAELDEKIDRRIDQLVAVKQEIMDAIAQVEDSRYRTLLTERYVNHKTWEQIKEIMRYSDLRYVYRLHGWALQAIRTTIECHD